MEIELKYAVKDEEVIKKILHDPYLESIKDKDTADCDIEMERFQ